MRALLALVLLQITSSAHGDQCSCTSEKASILPGCVSWIQAHFSGSPVAGSPVRPQGVTLMVGAADPSALHGKADFLDQLFGANATREFIKDAILLEQRQTPKHLAQMLLLSQSFMLTTDFLVATWHCTDDLGWCLRWRKSLEELKDKGGRKSFTAYRSGVDDATVCLCSVESPSFSSIPANVTLVSLNRTLEGKGSHRQLQSSISVRLPEHWQSQECNLVMLEHLPSSIFADGFELQRMVLKGALKEARIYGDLDLERPAFFSRQSILELHKPFEVEGRSARVHISVPLHVRYAPLSRESHYLANLSLPQISVTCENRIWCAEWKDGLTGNTVQWAIPTGSVAHAAFVPVCTTLAAAASTIILTAYALQSTWKTKAKAL